MEFVPALAMLALIKALVDLVRRLQAGGHAREIVLQIAAWVAGVAVVLLFAQTDWAEGLQFGDGSLADMGIWSQVVVGLTVGASAMLANDTLKAIDNKQTANPTPETNTRPVS